MHRTECACAFTANTFTSCILITFFARNYWLKLMKWFTWFTWDALSLVAHQGSPLLVNEKRKTRSRQYLDAVGSSISLSLSSLSLSLAPSRALSLSSFLMVCISSWDSLRGFKCIPHSMEGIFPVYWFTRKQRRRPAVGGAYRWERLWKRIDHWDGGSKIRWIKQRDQQGNIWVSCTCNGHTHTNRHAYSYLYWSCVQWDAKKAEEEHFDATKVAVWFDLIDFLSLFAQSKVSIQRTLSSILRYSSILLYAHQYFTVSFDTLRYS